MTATTNLSSPCQHDLFEAQAQRTPDAPAVVCEGRALTFAQLDVRANRLAHHLTGLGVGPDVRVGVGLGRSLDLAVSLLAVLKAGGACVPLDLGYPLDRLAFLIEDAAVAAILTDGDRAAGLPAGGPPLIRVDADADRWAALPATVPDRRVAADHVAYVIYTSGSTGQPRGVLLTHRGLVNHHRAAVDLYALGAPDRVLQFCSVGFDASIEEIFPTWASGATVVFRSDDMPILGRDWLGWLRSERISVLNLPTGYWHEWVRDLDRLSEEVPEGIRLVVVGGEKAQGAAYRTWLRVGGARCRWVNAYGPTEATCMTTVHERPPGDTGDFANEGDPPIGRPLPGTTARVVDEHGGPVEGGTGELLIGGIGLARGYLGHPDLTAERFVPDPTGGHGARLYRTGDLVRQLEGGELGFVGRMDDQVKIRGFRVECGEVEAALARHPGVADAAVVARDGPAGDRRLVAFVVGGATTAPAGELRRFLAERLPDHMVPSAFVALDTFPLTPNGKVDRGALSAPDEPDPVAESARTHPDTPAEQRMAAIWAEVLGIDPSSIGAGDDFFELGGHSLLATQVIAQVREDFGTDTPLRAIFEAPTVAALTALVAAEGAGDAIAPLTAQPRPPGARFPVSLAQEQMWALELAANAPGLYNVTAMQRLARPVDEAALRSAVALMVERHETLRTRFVVEDGRPAQVVDETGSVDLGVSDLGDTPDGEREAEVHRRTAEQDAAPFDLSQAPLLRAHLFHLDGRTSQLVVTFDHLICDGTSAEIFMAELAEAHTALSASPPRPPELPPLEVQFADYAVWQRSWLTDEVLRSQLEWWATTLAGMPLGPAVAFDRVPTEPSRRIARQDLTVPSATRELLQQLARDSQSSVFIVCTAAVQALLSRCGGMTDVVLSTTLNGRHRAELEGLLSMFAGMGRIRTDLSGDPPFTEVVRRARASVLGLFEHQDIPFLRVRQALLPDFPTDGPQVAAALPIELGYFHTPSSPQPEVELFFRGQLHPLSVTLLDDGAQIRAELSYKEAFYDEATISRLAEGLAAVLEAVGRQPSLRLSLLPVPPPPPF